MNGKKLKFKFEDKFFILAESGAKNDYIDTNDLKTLDTSNLSKEKNKVFNEKLNKEVEDKLNQEKPKIIDHFKANDKKYLALVKLEQTHQEQIKNKLLEKEKELNKKFIAEKEKWITEQKQLEIKLKELNQDKNATINEYKLSDEYVKKINQFQKAIQILEDDKKMRNNLNSKIIGNLGETEVRNEYDAAFNHCEDMDIRPINIPKGEQNTKGDFLITIYSPDENNLLNKDKKVIGKIVIEVKTEADKGKQKISSFSKKLKKDMGNEPAEWGLIITNLEPERTFNIIKDKNYENIYITRFNFFVPFLGFIKAIIQKTGQVIKDEIRFKDKQTILNEVNTLKNSILEGNLNSWRDDANFIQKKAENTKREADQIIKRVNEKLIYHMNQITKKIKNFDIKRKSINKIESINLSDAEMDFKKIDNVEGI